LSNEQVEAFKVKQAEVKKISKKNHDKKIITGVWFEESYVRKYPLSTVGCDVIGFSNTSNVGSYGVEEAYNNVLNGTNGREYGYFDSELNLQRNVKPATNGNNVILTIDANVQRIVEEHIVKYQSEVGSENIAVMLANPNNGEIYAMASNPLYDLNNPRDLTTFYSASEISKMTDEDKTKNLSMIWKNYCLSDAFEPGSTFKPFTVAAALDEALVSDHSSYVCNGKETVSGVTMRCVNRAGHGTITLGETLKYSCNDALVQIGLKLGRNLFSNYNKLYGFGNKTGIDLPGEATGILHSEDQLNPVELATSSFGQTQTVTMVQMMAGFCSLINGGNYYVPHVVKQIQNESGAEVENIEPVVSKKTISSTTSKLLREYMFETVESGTASGAQVKGYEIGGKTGTAEKRPVGNKKYLVSFIGFAPIDNPQVAIYVIIDEPNVEDQAHSSYATEFASSLMKEVLPFLGVYSK